MITSAMVEAGVSLEHFGVLPFPVDRPASLKNFLPTFVPVFTTICEPWNEYKETMLRTVGYDVRVLWRREEKVYEGIKVRHHIRLGDSIWRDMVPPATARVIEKYDIEGRLRALAAAE